MKRSASGGKNWKTTYQALQDQKVLELIQLQQNSNEKDAMIKLETDHSLKTLHNIDRNLIKVGKVLGSKSKSLRRLPKAKKNLIMNANEGFIRNYEKLAEQNPQSRKGIKLQELLDL